MQRYFIPKTQVEGDQAWITGEDVHHLMRVMRAQVGDEVILADGEGNVYHAAITELGSERVMLKLLEVLPAEVEIPVQITLAQSMPKGEKWDWILQKGTELGAHAFLPFISQRTVVKLDEKKEAKRRGRWERIVKEAAEQSHRSRIPQLHSIHSWPELLQRVNHYDLAILAYEGEEQHSLATFLQRQQELKSLLIVIGPEGGFSLEEVEAATSHGMAIVSLGPRILRTETAGLYALSCCSYQFEQIGGRK